MRIKVSPDICSTGLWDEDEVMIEYEDLNLPEELAAAFKSWIEFYDKECLDEDYNFKPSMSKQMNEIGRNLAKKLKMVRSEDEIMYQGEDGKSVFDLEST